MEQAAKTTAPSLTSALFTAWQQEASRRAWAKDKVALLQLARSERTRQRCLAGWHRIAKWKAESRRRVGAARANAASRAASSVLAAWRAAAAHARWRQTVLEQSVLQRARRIMAAWRGVAGAAARKQVLLARAGAHYLRRLLTCAMAHWRLLQLRANVRLRWDKVSVFEQGQGMLSFICLCPS